MIKFLGDVIEDPITPKLEQLINIWEVAAVEKHVQCPFGRRGGRIAHDRRLLARAFVAKTVYNLSTTEALRDMLLSHRALRRLCGYESIRQIPSSATFSRAFAEFAKVGLGDIVHAALVSEHVGGKVVMHSSRDSTEVIARERAAKKEKPGAEQEGAAERKHPDEQKVSAEQKPLDLQGVSAEQKAPEVQDFAVGQEQSADQKPVAVKKKRGRPKKGEVRQAPEPKRLNIQLAQNAVEALNALPKICNWGVKKDTGGHTHCWKGWKAHIDYADDAIPINVVTTAASVHDSQVAIPMARITAERVDVLYELMDSAYDAPQIRKAIEDLGHVAIIDPNPRRGGVPVESIFDPAKAKRYNERTTAERGNSRLKDDFGLRHLRVRGHAKAHLHIMFGILALFADQILRPIRA